jgi:hypothetical protein
MYVCMYVCVCVCMYVCICCIMYVCMHICMYVCMHYVRMYVKFTNEMFLMKYEQLSNTYGSVTEML